MKFVCVQQHRAKNLLILWCQPVIILLAKQLKNIDFRHSPAHIPSIVINLRVMFPLSVARKTTLL